MHKKKIDFGHLKSQKFAGFIFAVSVCFLAGIFQYSEPTTSAVVMGIVALYASFVGARAYSDGAALKFGGTINPAEVAPIPDKKDVKEKEVD